MVLYKGGRNDLDGFYGLVEFADISQLFDGISQLAETSQFLMLNLY